MARTGLLHVPGDECRPAGAGRTLRLDLEPQLRRPARTGRPHPSGVARHGRCGGHRRPLCGCARTAMTTGSDPPGLTPAFQRVVYTNATVTLKKINTL